MEHCKRCKEFKSHCTVFIRGRDRAVPCRLHIHILFDSIAVPSSVCWIVTQNAVVFHWNLVCARNANNSLSSSLSSTCCVRRNAMRTKNAALPLSTVSLLTTLNAIAIVWICVLFAYRLPLILCAHGTCLHYISLILNPSRMWYSYIRATRDGTFIFSQFAFSFLFSSR